MRKVHLLSVALALALGCGLASPAQAAMPADGAPAPPIPVLQSVIGGEYQAFDLAAASSGKTLVLYFFPEAFTEG